MMPTKRSLLRCRVAARPVVVFRFSLPGACIRAPPRRKTRRAKHMWRATPSVRARPADAARTASASAAERRADVLQALFLKARRSGAKGERSPSESRNTTTGACLQNPAGRHQIPERARPEALQKCARKASQSAAATSTLSAAPPSRVNCMSQLGATTATMHSVLLTRRPSAARDALIETRDSKASPRLTSAHTTSVDGRMTRDESLNCTTSIMTSSPGVHTQGNSFRRSLVPVLLAEFVEHFMPTGFPRRQALSWIDAQQAPQQVHEAVADCSSMR